MNSSRFTFPTMTPPAVCTRSTQVAVYGARKFARMREAAVEYVPRAQNISFTEKGTPPKGPGSSPTATLRSTASAWARACSSVKLMKECMLRSSAGVSSPASSEPGRPSTTRMRCKVNSSISTAETRRWRSRSDNSWADRSQRSMAYSRLVWGMSGTMM